MLLRHGHDVEQVLFGNDHIAGLGSKITSALSSFYSLPSYQQTSKFIKRFKPDVLHVHNFVPTLSPSIFFAGRHAGVPVVHTLHNYRMICATAMLLRDGVVCEECPKARSFLPGVRHACYRNSKLGSMIMGANTSVHAALGTWQHRIDRYIALTEFAADKLGEFRIPRDKIRIKPNFVPDLGKGEHRGEFALFVGRLSEEKGIHTLLDADHRALLPLPLWIAGDGPLLPLVQQATNRPGSRIRILGKRSPQEVNQLMKDAAVLVFPSIWYEGLPMVLIEALSSGLPVLLSRVGGLPQIFDGRSSALLFEPGNVDSFLDGFARFGNTPEAVTEMSMETRQMDARRLYLEKFTEKQNYRILMGIYSELVRTPESLGIA